MAILKREGNRLIREYDGEKLWIEPWGGSALRVRCTRCYKMDESQDWALLPREGGEAKITIDGQEAAIQNGGITAKIEKSGKVLFYNRQGGLLLEEYLRTEEAVGGFNSLLKVKARDLRPVIGGEYSLTMRFESKRDERLYGMGQYQQSILNLKGATLELAQRNSQASVPFLLSDSGYGFLWNNPAIGRATFGTNLTEWEAKSTQQLDYWICAGDAPAEIVERYSAATGRPPMMPDYATGFWQCKLRYQTQEELLQVAREYKRRGLPLSVIVIDYFHWPNQGTWQFDREYWPDPEGMVRELRELGVELMVSVWPTVDSESPNFPLMLERGLLAQTDRGVRTQMQFLGNETFFDATNPEAREFVWNECKKNYYDYGIRSFWLDAAEPEYSTYDFDLYRYSLGSNLKVGNIYPALYAKAFYDGLRREGEDPLMLIRCAWAGSQRYGTLVWSGDIHSSFESMRDQFAAGLSMSIAGIPWWTTDIGGFNGGDIHDPYFHEVLVRWFQYGAFCPVMRLHGSRLPWKEPLSDKVGGGMCSSGAENEVYSFGGPVYEICKDYMQLRERLRPYVTGLMAEAHKKGTPPMRPMFYDFPHQKEAWETEDQYMFGPDVLVAPVMYHGMRERGVWLPEGREWIDTATGERFAGGQRIVCQAPIERMPVFCSNEALSITIRGSH
ncbi:MAG: glycoside hydrolase family 31 protein [Clostridiales bacterium]|uniref:glycoside hydrolase family 31 protein n=1 Tax=Provencibacterium massiliense TaxID=1841868 RepID=UPI0009A8BB8E|nr:glycoside hydrolase family 31 protein [Provencibacterium massiliense]PWM35182.1 MAG: glycoside hydrolase family 31 protein [Clostridiales bacterium]RGB68887.1 glycoside hydrolase family 31 protein [Harryflintia acetispora]